MFKAKRNQYTGYKFCYYDASKTEDICRIATMIGENIETFRLSANTIVYVAKVKAILKTMQLAKMTTDTPNIAGCTDSLSVLQAPICTFTKEWIIQQRRSTQHPYNGTIFMSS